MPAVAFRHKPTPAATGPFPPWDARSQAIITRADYIARHIDCPGGSPALSHTESVSPGGPQGSWLVHDQIVGQQLTDYWFYVRRRGSSAWSSATPTRSGSTGCPRASTSRPWAAHTDLARSHL